MPRLPGIIWLLLIMVVFRGKVKSQNTVPQHANAMEKVGWIPFDATRDRAGFKVCDELNIEEYYQVNPRYGEGMYSIRKFFRPYLPELEKLCETDGYVVVRFVINCQGETDRYRSRFLLPAYTEAPEVNQALQARLRELVAKMGPWTPGAYNGRRYDAYQHIKFLFKGHQLVDILY